MPLKTPGCFMFDPNSQGLHSSNVCRAPKGSDGGTRFSNEGCECVGVEVLGISGKEDGVGRNAPICQVLPLNPPPFTSAHLT